MNGPIVDATGRAPLPDWWWNLSLLQRRIAAAAIVGGVIVTLVVVLFRDSETDADRFVRGLDPARVAQWDGLAECESESDWALASGNGFFGGVQFTLESWREVGGAGHPHENSRAEQIFRAEQLHDLQGWDAWPSCARQLGFG